MSETILRLIPTDPRWQPAPDAARTATEVFAALVPRAAEVAARFFAELVFCDPGSNLERVGCPACGSELALDWWSVQMERSAATTFSDLGVTTPCCGARTSLDDLAYDWPAGFARYELSARDPDRDRLGDAELTAVGQVLGHPLRQVVARY